MPAAKVSTLTRLVPRKDSGEDPVAWWLKIAIFLLVVTGIIGVLYALVIGLINPSTPRTATEAKLIVLQNAVKTVPASGAARRDYALALAATGQPDKAMAEIARGKKDLKGLDKTEVYIAQLSILFDQKKYAEVIKVAQEATTYDQAARAAIIKQYAKPNVKFGDADLPQEAAIQILVFDARAKGATQDWNGAIASLTAAVKRDTQASDLYYMRGSAYQKLGDKAKARADYTTALKYVPGYAPAEQGLKQLGN